MIDALRRANTFFDRVIERVPEFAPVYLLHSDLYTHILQDDANGRLIGNVSEADVQGANAAALADFQAANRYARNNDERILTAFDLAFVSSDWNDIVSRAERLLAGPPCLGSGNWAGAFPFLGVAKKAHAFYLERIECDPKLSILWFQGARAALWMGDTDEALRLARGGLETAPGAWLNLTLARALIARGEHQQAIREIDNRVTDGEAAVVFKVMSAASAGDLERADELMLQHSQLEDRDPFWDVHIAAWRGDREAANRIAAAIDAHPFGSVTLGLHVVWCGCGAPWDLEATPNFAAELHESNIPWPPAQPVPFPLKGW